MSELSFGNSNWLDIEIWKAKLDANGRVLRDANGEPVLDTLKSRRTMHNAVTTTMLGYEVNYISHRVATKPVNRIKFDYTAASAYGTTSKTSTQGTATATTVWTATWTNETGGSVTVATVSLLNLSLTTDTVFATAAPAQAVADHEVMRVNWTHVWTKGGSDQGTSDNMLDQLQAYFDGTVTTTYLPDYFTFADTSAPTYSANGSITVAAGGAITDTTVTLVAAAQNTSTTVTYTLDTVTFYVSDLSGSAIAVFAKTGLSQAWAPLVTITGTLVITAAVT